MNNHQKSTFRPLGDFLNPALVLLGQGLIKSPIWQKLNFANHPYLCKGLYLLISTFKPLVFFESEKSACAFIIESTHSSRSLYSSTPVSKRLSRIK
ncbi:hypothetical protein [Bathymodiolus heckerae thiotrophic gill symbiont]|uniref:hypothetical protein n=1 Tax=Bathymodiolus heckerae thiotrophic gill symbiont TaxID=1052212 RepID=UPI001485ABEA|nr:hypothetical protein [Bathymodiolus heckerae thiotrophic gill symbiont]